jgi:glycerol-3-phosphate dehydrogenase (NAD(P)+)
VWYDVYERNFGFLKDLEISRVAVIGAGSWGTALANLLAEKEGVDVQVWVREQEVYAEIAEKHLNQRFLPGVKLISALKPTRSFKEALQQKEAVLIAVPSHVFREVLEGLKPHLRQDMSVMMATKGIENGSLMIMSQVVQQVLGAGFSKCFACLAGPSFAKEVSRKLPTAVSIACEDRKPREKTPTALFDRFFSRLSQQGCGGNPTGRGSQECHRHCGGCFRRIEIRF